MPPRPSCFRALIALFLGVCCLACNLENQGDAPPRATIYFPNALALSPPREDEEQTSRYLYVVNSNFDLRYNAGTVQAYSLDRVAAALDDCKRGDPCVIEADAAFVDEVRIPSFSTALGSSADGRRLVATTRTGDAPSYLQVDPGTDDDDAVLRCRGGCEPDADETFTDRYDGREMGWPEQPVAVITGLLADWYPAPVPREPGELEPEAPTAPVFEDADEDEYVLVAHRRGELSLFVERNGSLEMTAVSRGAPVEPTDLAYDATTKLIYTTALWPTSSRVLGRFGVLIPERDGVPDPSQANLYQIDDAVLEPFDASRNTHSITFLPNIPDAGSLFETPSALVVTQSPSALVLADVAREGAPTRSGFALATARVKASASLGFGASRMAAGVVNGVPIAVVASFESRELALVDLRTMVVRSVVPNLSGPYAVELDEGRGLAFVTDFRSSVIRVLDVKPALEPGGSEPLEVIATLGKPRVLQELK